MATRADPPKKVRLACRRCRTRRIKCDGQVPACTNCAKSGEVCLDVDSQNSDLVVPRNFASAARARIQWLEDIILERLPDVDLKLGPQVDAFPDYKGVSTQREVEDATISTPSSATGYQQAQRSYSQVSQRPSLKRPADGHAMTEMESSFPERAHSVAVNLGMLSLNSDSSQKYYLGSSSGVLFTNLIGASPSSSSSTAPAGEEPPPSGRHWGYPAAPYDIRHQNYRKLHELLRQELPRRSDAEILVQTYIRWIHPDYPILELVSLRAALDVVYACSNCSLDDDRLPGGWPSSVPSFQWNGQQIRPDSPGSDMVPMPVIAFILFMVFNIGAIIKVRSRVYEYPPERFYRTALQFSKDCFSQISLSSIQALVTIMIHCLLTPAEVNIWTLIHVGMAHCVEIGIHREPASVNLLDLQQQQIKRYIFYTIYSLDRAVSSIQGRPLGFRDETFDVKIPDPQMADLTPEGRLAAPSFLSAVAQYSSHQFEMDRIVSDIKLHLYHLPVESISFPWPDAPTAHQQRIHERLAGWWNKLSRNDFDFGGLDNRRRHIWRLKLKIRYHTTMVLLFQPSQAIRTPSDDSLQLCFDNACCILNDYQMLHDHHGLYHGWRSVQNVFAAGATLIYSFWTSEAVQRNVSAADLSKSLRACSSLLSVGGEWWPSAKKGQGSFGAIVDLTIQKLYMDMPPSKQPRLILAQGLDGTTPLRQRGGTHPNADLDGHDNVVDNVLGTQQPVSNDVLPRATIDLNQKQGTNLYEVPGDWDIVHPEIQASAEYDFAPEIESFLADFDRAGFSWRFPLNDMGDVLENPDQLDTTF